MSDLRLVQFADIRASLEATKQHDDSFMASSRSAQLVALAQQRTQPSYLLAIYKGDDLL